MREVLADLRRVHARRPRRAPRRRRSWRPSRRCRRAPADRPGAARRWPRGSSARSIRTAAGLHARMLSAFVTRAHKAQAAWSGGVSPPGRARRTRRGPPRSRSAPRRRRSTTGIRTPYSSSRASSPSTSTSSNSNGRARALGLQDHVARLVAEPAAGARVQDDTSHRRGWYPAAPARASACDDGDRDDSSSTGGSPRATAGASTSSTGGTRGRAYGLAYRADRAADPRAGRRPRRVPRPLARPRGLRPGPGPVPHLLPVPRAPPGRRHGPARGAPAAAQRACVEPRARDDEDVAEGVVDEASSPIRRDGGPRGLTTLPPEQRTGARDGLLRRTRRRR